MTLEVGKLFLELAIHEWEEMSEIGSSYSKQVQKQVDFCAYLVAR